MTSGYSKDLPDPPVYFRSALHIPPFFGSSHPYTKWMLNMLRGNANHRLTIMVKERPELFHQYYQIADQPDVISCMYYDSLPIFHTRCVLYLTPLGLAIYLKREKAVEMLLKSGVNNPQQSCFATEVFTKGNRRADILELLPACIAIRREFLEAIPLLCNTIKVDETSNESIEQKTLKVQEPLVLNYENRECQRSFRYRDLLHYATETMQRRPNFPLCRLLDILMGDCHGFKYIDEQSFSEKTSNPISLFRRLARIAYYQDTDLRHSLQLIGSLDSLIRSRSCIWRKQNTNKATDENFIAYHVAHRDSIDIDHDASLGLLCGHYQRIREKTRHGPLDHMGQLIFRFLSYTRWRLIFLKSDTTGLQTLFKNIDENISIYSNTLLAIQKHMQMILSQEREREMITTVDTKLRPEKGRTITPCRLQDKKHIVNTSMPETTQHNNKVVFINKKKDKIIDLKHDLNGSLFSYRQFPASEDTSSNSVEHSINTNIKPENCFEAPIETEVARDDKASKKRQKELGDVEDDDLGALESDWQELELNEHGDGPGGVDASLIDFIYGETKPNEPAKESAKSSSLDTFIYIENTIAQNESNNCQTDEEIPGFESDTVYDETVNRMDMDAYEDRVLHEMLEEFLTSKGTASSKNKTMTTNTSIDSKTASFAAPIYGSRKYNHNQRSNE